MPLYYTRAAKGGSHDDDTNETTSSSSGPGIRAPTLAGPTPVPLHTPLAELNPPGLPPGRRACLRSLPEANRLKLSYAFKALEPLAERSPDAAYGALHLTDIPPT
ncbi:MAG: hypothetical protein GY856_34965 [bacterium]|nr:hypothetical protein [bacterium]